MPKMRAVPTRAEYPAAKSGRDVHTGSMTCDDARPWSMPGRKMFATEVPTSKLRATTEMPATAMTAAVPTTGSTSRGSLRRKR